MAIPWEFFDKRLSIREKVAINQQRTPTERFLAMCDLMDFIRATARMDPKSIERRRRKRLARDEQRKRDHAAIRAIVARTRAEASATSSDVTP